LVAYGVGLLIGFLPARRLLSVFLGL